MHVLFNERIQQRSHHQRHIWQQRVLVEKAHRNGLFALCHCKDVELVLEVVEVSFFDYVFEHICVKSPELLRNNQRHILILQFVVGVAEEVPDVDITPDDLPDVTLREVQLENAGVRVHEDILVEIVSEKPLGNLAGKGELLFEPDVQLVDVDDHLFVEELLLVDFEEKLEGVVVGKVPLQLPPYSPQLCLLIQDLKQVLQ